MWKPPKCLKSSRVHSSPGLLMTSMQSVRPTVAGFAVVLLLVWLCPETTAHRTIQDPDMEFGPVVRAYLGYLRNEQEVVDDRVSRREVNQVYYRRNSNRIRALREMALRLARQTHNDYLPELEAVARDEFGLLFHRPPRLGMARCCRTHFASLARCAQVRFFMSSPGLTPMNRPN